MKKIKTPSASVRSEIPGTISQNESPKISTLVIFPQFFTPNSSKILQDITLVFHQIYTFFCKKFSYIPKSLQFWHILKIKTPCKLSWETIRCRKWQSPVRVSESSTFAYIQRFQPISKWESNTQHFLQLIRSSGYVLVLYMY